MPSARSSSVSILCSAGLVIFPIGIQFAHHCLSFQSSTAQCAARRQPTMSVLYLNSRRQEPKRSNSNSQKRLIFWDLVGWLYRVAVEIGLITRRSDVEAA